MPKRAATTDHLLGELRALCAGLPGSEEYVMVHHPAFRVGKKPFAIVGMRDGDQRVTVSINLGRDEQPLLLDDPRFTRTGYIGQHGWVTIARDALSAEELHALIADSWRRVAGKRNLDKHAGGIDASAPAKPRAAKRKAAKRAPAERK